MNFLVDNQLPPTLAHFIRTDLGAQAVHVSEIGLDRASDRLIWQHASEHDLIIISKDEDFVTLYFGAPSARLLWVRTGNSRRARILEVFWKAWPRISARFTGGERFVELR